ncbi:glycosyltransferase family 4 protein [Duncaniella muris]|uniref:glycosyltransferase family 4 protein n=1 Tax=Duncaniella muris TaxID=2094150 RepID=UPI001C3D191A|nr:glycosyltransferase family 4 protein [Duncaniella muris]
MKEFVYILPNAAWGVASVVSNLIRYSAHPNIHKKVILIDAQKTRKPCDTDFGNAEIIVVTPKSSWIESKYSFAKRVSKYLTPDSIIISNDGNPEYSMVEMLKLKNPVVSVLHGDYRHYFNGGSRYGYLIDRMICVSSYLAKKAKEQFAPNTNPIFIPFPTPNIDLPAKNYDQPLKISYAGGITTAKGCEHFPEVVRLLDNNNVKYIFNIFGDGELLSYLKAQIGHNSKVIFHGKQSNKTVLKHLKDTHITIHLSKGEGLPVCLVEAMKCGSVPIVFDLPTGIPDLIDDEINGFRLSQGDINGVVEKIIYLSLDRHMLTMMSCNAIKKVYKMFDAFEETRKYEELFLNVHSYSDKFKVYRRTFKNDLLDSLPIKLSGIIKNIASSIK